MTRYFILNSAVITAPGTYEYDLIPLSQAKTWLHVHDWESCIGYEETAKALSKITGFEIPVNRKVITMEKGDEALVFRLVFPSGFKPDPSKKGQLSEEFILENCEIGHLGRVG